MCLKFTLTKLVTNNIYPLFILGTGTLIVKRVTCGYYLFKE